jgi:lysozyme family protein
VADFLSAFYATDAREGGYAHIAGDRGGETYRGISRVYWPAWEGWAVIDRAKAEPDHLSAALGRYRAELEPMVWGFYEGAFWKPLGLGRLASQAIANEVYDTAVNMGKRVAAMFLQEACNKVNFGLRVAELAEDGILGGRTRAVANAIAETYEDALLVALNVRQGMGYWLITDADPSQKRWLRGWLRQRVAL